MGGKIWGLSVIAVNLLPYTERSCPLEFTSKPNLQNTGIRMWGLWEVIKSQGWSLINVILKSLYVFTYLSLYMYLYVPHEQDYKIHTYICVLIKGTPENYLAHSTT